MYRLSTILTTLFLLVSLSAVAQDEDSSPRWAIDGQVGGNITSKASSPASGVPRLRALSTSCTGLVTKLHVEYYLPKTNFSLKAGYEHEELTFLKGDASADLSQLMLGGRWYPTLGIGQSCHISAWMSCGRTTATEAISAWMPQCRQVTAK